MWNSSLTKRDLQFTTISINHKNPPQRVTKTYYDFELHGSHEWWVCKQITNWMNWMNKYKNKH